MTPEEAAKRAVAALSDVEEEDAGTLVSAVESILNWNGEYTPNSAGALLVKFWRLKCEEEVDVAAIVKGEELKEEDLAKLVPLLADTLAELKKKYGTLDLTWGDVHKVGRGGKLFPAPGADFGRGPDKIDFTETLFDVRCSENDEGIQVADNGSMATTLMFLHPDGIESYSCIPWGQSANPDSGHYMDQGAKLYSTRTFKPSWFKKEELLANVESEKVFSPK